MPERRAVERAKLGDRERRGREREADVRVGELRPQALPAREGDRAVVERRLGQLVDRVPGRVLRDLRVDVRGDEPDVGGGDDPCARVTRGSLRVSSCSRWDSSRTSTLAARCRRIDCSSVSPGSSRPPGSDHAPSYGSRARCQRSTWSTPSRTWSTTASASWRGHRSVLDFSIGFRFIDANSPGGYP